MRVEQKRRIRITKAFLVIGVLLLALVYLGWRIYRHSKNGIDLHRDDPWGTLSTGGVVLSFLFLVLIQSPARLLSRIVAFRLPGGDRAGVVDLHSTWAVVFNALVYAVLLAAIVFWVRGWWLTHSREDERTDKGHRGED